MFKLILGGLFLVAVASPASAMMASAATGKSADVVNVTGSFAEQRHAIEKKLADGKTYSEISANDRSLVKDALGRISTTLEASGGIEALSETQKTAVFNDQEVINNILTKAGEDSRLVCERVEKLGSHRKTTVCLTVAERRRVRESSEGTLRRVQNATPSLKGG
jgi:hypothetical protein